MITNEQKNLLHKYEEAKRAEKEAKAMVDELKEAILEIVPEDVELDTGTAIFTKSPGKAKWKYSDDLTDREKELKAEQKLEVQNNIATKVHGDPFITVRLKNE